MFESLILQFNANMKSILLVAPSSMVIVQDLLIQ